MLIAALLALAVSAVALAQSGNGFDLSWSTVDGGGGLGVGGGYAMQGTIGQADAGELAGGSYTFTGGFLSDLPAPSPETSATATPTGEATVAPTEAPSATPTGESTATSTGAPSATRTPAATATSPALYLPSLARRYTLPR